MNFTFKKDNFGFFMNGKFNGFTYAVQSPVNGISTIKNRLNGSTMKVDLLTVTLLDEYNNDITPILLEGKSEVLSIIVNWKIIASSCSLIKRLAVSSLDEIEGGTWKSIIGNQSRVPRTGYSYHFNGIDNYLQGDISLANAEYLDINDEWQPITFSPTARLFEGLDITVKALIVDGQYRYNFEEEDGTVAYSTNGETLDLKGTLSTMHVEDTTKEYSKANDIGYSKGQNLLKSSEDFDNVNWIKSDVTLSNGFEGPTGGSDAWKVIKTTIDGYLYYNLAFVGTDSRTSKIWVKGTLGETVIIGAFEGNDLTTLTGEWQLVETATMDGNARNPRAYACDFRGGTATEILIYHPQYYTDYNTVYVKTLDTALEEVIIPIDETTGLDIFGNTPTYTGEVAYNGELDNFPMLICNGFDNTININHVASKINSDVDGFVEFSISYTTTSLNYVVGASQSQTVYLGIRIFNGALQVVSGGIDGINVVQTTTLYNDGVTRKVKAGSFNGKWFIEVDGIDNELDLILGSNTGHWFNSLLINNLRIGSVFTSSNILLLDASLSHINISDKVLIPFSERYGRTVYDVISNTPYEILGTTPEWGSQNVYNYNLNNGFGDYSDINHVVNGDFENGLVAPWVPSVSTLSVVNNQLVVEGISPVTANQKAQQTITGLTANKEYILDVDIIHAGSSATGFIIANATFTSNGLSYSYPGTEGNFKREFKMNAGQTTLILSMHAGILPNASTSIFDNIKVYDAAQYPASQLVIGEDVIGNFLTNPASKLGDSVVGLNNDGTTLTYPLAPALIQADIDNYIFTTGGTANILTFDDLPENYNNYIYSNLITNENKAQFSVFPLALEEYSEDKLIQCFDQRTQEAIGTEYLRDENGVTIKDENNTPIEKD